MSDNQLSQEPSSRQWRYACFGFEMQVDFPLPELVELPVAGTGLPLILVRRERLRPSATLPTARGGLSVEDQGVAFFTVPGIARYRVSGGTEIVVEAEEGASESNVRLYLLGSALGILCYQRGLLPLHANAIAAEGGAFAFTGGSGAGKSTLAAHFHRSGYRVLTDDLCAVSFDDTGRPMVLPGLPKLRLWADAARAFGYDPPALDRAIDGEEKYHVPLGVAGEQTPFPLKRLYVLERTGPGRSAGPARRLGLEALSAVVANTYRDSFIAPLGLREQHFRQCSNLLVHAEVWSAPRTWGLDIFAAEAGVLERHMVDALVVAGRS